MMTDTNRQWWLLAVVLLAVCVVPAPATAVSATANETPRAAQVGENVSATVTLDDLYTEAPKAWRLRATTQLDDATWRVTAYGLDGSELATRSFEGRSLGTPVRASRNVSSVEVRVTGTAPPVSNFTYRPGERFVLASLGRVHNGTPPAAIGNWSAHHYTAGSRSARRELDAARAAIGTDDDELEEEFGFAVSAYRNGNFGLAADIAADANETAHRPDYPVELVSGVFLGGLVVAFGAAGIRSYRTRSRDDDPWPNR